MKLVAGIELGDPDVRMRLLVRLVGLVGVVGSTCGSLAQTPAASWQGYYVLAAGGSTTSNTFVEVDVFPAYEGQALFIDFMVRRESPDRVLGAVSPATNVGDGQFTFSFTDADGNRGRGRFSRVRTGYSLHLQRADSGTGRGRVAELYGDYRLVRKDATGQTDRHPWSLGKRQTPPG